MGKIIIADNGGEYSDHTIYFIETDLDPVASEKLVSILLSFEMMAK